MHVDRMSMELLILCFKGEQIENSKLGNFRFTMFNVRKSHSMGGSRGGGGQGLDPPEKPQKYRVS